MFAIEMEWMIGDEASREWGFVRDGRNGSETGEGRKEKGGECDRWIVVCGIALKSVVRECERQTAWNETAKKEAARFFSWKHRGARQSERAGEAESRDYFGIGQR